MDATNLVRLLIGAVGVLLLVGGLLALTGGAGINAFWLLALGGVLLVIAAIEVTRYRSDADDQPTDARFRRTDEVFIDPTTRRSMRVYADPRTGERKYVAED